MNKSLYIFCDASFCPKTKRAVLGTYILTSLNELPNIKDVKTKVIDCDNCNQAEIKAALESLSYIKESQKLKLITDCQTLFLLPNRREKLEQRSYQSLKTKKVLKNADLYKSFFKLYDFHSIEIKWVKGHIAKNKAEDLHRFFSLVDKKTRKELRSL